MIILCFFFHFRSCFDYLLICNNLIKKENYSKIFKNKKYSNSSEFKGKLEIGNKSSAEFDTKFIYIVKLFAKSDSSQRFLQDFVQSSAIQINLVSNSAAYLLPVSLYFGRIAVFFFTTKQNNSFKTLFHYGNLKLSVK